MRPICYTFWYIVQMGWRRRQITGSMAVKRAKCYAQRGRLLQGLLQVKGWREGRELQDFLRSEEWKLIVIQRESLSIPDMYTTTSRRRLLSRKCCANSGNSYGVVSY